MNLPDSTEATEEPAPPGLTIRSSGKSGLDLMDASGDLETPGQRRLTEAQRKKIRAANKAERQRKRKLRTKRRK